MWGEGIWEIKTSSKTKEEVAEGGPLRVTNTPCTSEPIREVETDVTDSGAQLGSVSNFLAGNSSIFPRQRVSVRASPFTKLVSSFKAVLTFKLLGQYYSCYMRSIHFATDALQAQMGSLNLS